MLLTYVDESYTKERYYIAALLVHDTRASALTSALDAVVTKAMCDHGSLHPRTELHAHNIVAGKNEWAPLASKVRARIGVYDSALRAIAQHGDAIFLRGLDIERLNRRYPKPDHPHSIVLTHLLERVDEYAEQRGEYALMIADEVSEQAEHRRSLWRYQQDATWGWRRRKIERVVDTIHFAPSDASRLVQAADLVAYLHRRRETHTESDARAERANARLYDHIKPLIRHAGCWRP